MKFKNRIIQSALRRVAIRANVEYGVRIHIGPGSVVWAPSGLRIGNDVYVGKNVTIQVAGEIGDGVLFANGSGVVGRRDHDYAQIGETVRRARWVGEHQDLSKPAIIGSDVWIGFNATVYSGVRVGNTSIVAAGSVVTRDVPDNSIVAGTPARLIRKRFSDDDFQSHWKMLRAKGVRWVEMNSVVGGDR